MNHTEHVGLVRAGVVGAGPRWLELGAGGGAFTIALADVLGPEREIVAVDRDRSALARLPAIVEARFPGRPVRTLAADFGRPLDIEPASFDGILAANALHFVRDQTAVLDRLRPLLDPAGGRLVVVEYDADLGNPWVPYPFSFETFREIARAAGFGPPQRIGGVPSRFLGAIYAATAPVAGSTGARPV